MKTIPLTQGQFAKVDDDDFEKFGSVKWYAAWCKSTRTFYVHRVVKVGGKNTTLRLHRYIMGNPVGMVVDHKNHDTLDCQKENLRICTSSQNKMNGKGARRDSLTGLRGVTAVGKRFSSHIRVKGNLIHLGYFKDKMDASLAYQKANKKYFGEFGGGF